MAIQSIQIFNPDPGKASDLGGLTAAQVFAAPLSRIENLSGAGNTQPFNATESGDYDAPLDSGYGASQETPSLFTPMDGTKAATSQAEELFRSRASDSPSNPADVSVPGGDITSFVKEFEGFSAKAFGDYKQTSIGYGTVGKPGEVIDRPEAERRLAAELRMHRDKVLGAQRKYGYDFTDNELDALTSFSYNIGSIDQLVDRGKRDKNQIADAMLRYNKAGGKRLEGLARRRAAERALFRSGY